MSVIYILIPIAIIFTAIAIYLFFWAVKTEQFDDLEKQGMSILFDDEPASKTHNDSQSATNKTSESNSLNDPSHSNKTNSANKTGQ